MIHVLAAAVLLQDPTFAWRTDLEAAMADARRDGKPVLIVFR
jgi:hypothetical protein